MVDTADAGLDWLDWSSRLISIRGEPVDWAGLLECLCRLIPADGAQIDIDGGATPVFSLTVGEMGGAGEHVAKTIIGNRRFSLAISSVLAFDPSTAQRAERMVKQLQQRLRADEDVTRALRLRASLNSALERLPIGALILDAKLRVQLQTEGARRLLARRDGLRLIGPASGGSTFRSDGGPVFSVLDTRADDDLRACIERLALPDATDHEHVISVPRTSGRPYGLLVAALTRGAPEPDFLVLVSDPDAPTTLQPEALRQLYRLTPAESRLCAALAKGDTLKSYAQAEGVSLETVRSQLKQAMVKTSTHKQAQLVRLLVTGPAAYTS